MEAVHYSLFVCNPLWFCTIFHQMSKSVSYKFNYERHSKKSVIKENTVRIRITAIFRGTITIILMHSFIHTCAGLSVRVYTTYVQVPGETRRVQLDPPRS